MYKKLKPANFFKMELCNKEDRDADRVKVSIELPTYTVEQREQKLRELLIESVPEMYSTNHPEDRYMFSYIHSNPFLI